MSSVIEVSNLSKIYRLGEIGTGTISRDLERWFKTKVRGQEDPFLKIGETNDRGKTGVNDIVYSLREINFDVKQGEAIGIIGRNGAGKSTLLKIISQVTSPSAGKIKIKGRIASLLEVGTGFHPELTGRENIFLNGAILGMRKHEIKRKFDEIVDFSGVERYIDTPVKRYSSGMYVRLAFAVAAHLESEILIVDEVLAVGDAEFQKKCLGKMNDVRQGEGRTVLFVSHNMSAVKSLCSSGLLLNNGRIEYIGNVASSIEKYLTEPVKLSSIHDFLRDPKSRRGYGEVRFTEVVVNGGEITSDPTKETRVKLKALFLEDVPSISFSFFVFGSYDETPITSGHLIDISKQSVSKNSSVIFELLIPENTFRTGLFPLYLWLGRKGELASENYMYDCIDKVFSLNFTTTKNKEELGYNPLEPTGLLNIDFKVENCNLTFSN